jgi:hypothetical protein
MIPETDRLRIELHIGSSALVSTAAHEQGHARLPDSNRWLRRWRYRTFCNWPQSQQLLHFAFAFLGILLAPRKKKKNRTGPKLDAQLATRQVVPQIGSGACKKELC